MIIIVLFLKLFIYFISFKISGNFNSFIKMKNKNRINSVNMLNDKLILNKILK